MDQFTGVRRHRRNVGNLMIDRQDGGAIVALLREGRCPDPRGIGSVAACGRGENGETDCETCGECVHSPPRDLGHVRGARHQLTLSSDGSRSSSCSDRREDYEGRTILNRYGCPATFTGTELFVVLPSPSWPRSLPPQQ